MELSSSQTPAIPPRRSTQSTTPPPQRSATSIPSRRLRQSRTPPPRCSALNTAPSRRTTQSRTPPPRSSVQNRTSPPEDIIPPPVPARWDLCTNHVGHKYTAVCITCVKFLCNKCLLSEIYYHNQCSVVYLSDNIQQACHALKETVCENMERVNKTLTNFQTCLCKKRDRMFKKKNETISEIKHYYHRLRKLILSKLQRDEEELLKMMKGKVDEQDAVILDKIQQCCATTGTLQDKHAIIQTQEQLIDSRSNISGIECVKELVNASNYLKECERVQKDVAAVRDAFLVIRFFVNSETEQIILNSNVACVEVLNSQSENRQGVTLESERINEAARLQAISNESVNNSHGGSIERINENDELRVTLPPPHEQALDNLTDLPNNRDDSPVCRPHTDPPSEESGSLADHISDLINEFDTRLVNRSDDTEETSTVNVLTNEMILSNLLTDTAPITERGGSSVTGTSNQTTPNISADCNENAHNEVQEGSSETVDTETVDTHLEASEMDRRQSVAITVSSEPNTSAREIPVQDDDPPPPYPGLTSTPEPPGPDELPPPYPGSGPPPPYSQMPEAQQPPGRGRLQGESGRDCSRMSRHSSDSDLQSRPLEIAAPTQTSTPRLSRPKVSKAFSANEANDRRVSGIFALTSVRGKAFLIVDRWNKKLKYFSSDGASFGGLIFREEPWDITDMTEELVAVTVPKLMTLYKIKVTDSSVITTSTVPTPRSYACVAFNKVSQLFVCGQVPQFGEPVVDIIGIDGGQIIQTFRTGFNNELRFSYPRYLKVNEEGTAIVCDWNLKCLIVFKLDGSVVGRYRGTVEFPLNEPTGIAYNQLTKEIYVIDAKHNSTLGAIHIVNLNCRCKEIVRWDNEFRVARAIAPHANGYALGNKSGVLSIFATRQRR
ncbi:uncharacterized protein LOC123531625 [Mercenaria mercenaria]|uniref:uncharacterized protein LOC123531625 n=1 Tax=Mercenaria mercenaria TaxID=6596 RepID=UPI00234F188F|nr:uncharacterized protein LOC123531625 [Mercenaria mercenaria]